MHDRLQTTFSVVSCPDVHAGGGGGGGGGARGAGHETTFSVALHEQVSSAGCGQIIIIIIIVEKACAGRGWERLAGGLGVSDVDNDQLGMIA